MHSWENKGIK